MELFLIVRKCLHFYQIIKILLRFISDPEFLDVILTRIKMCAQKRKFSEEITVSLPIKK